ncbi:leucyl/phenylalanyl-tRNA--protein transferase [Yimella sp. cx-51]|uniref:leucyl/phenylalanyl-tRNA--protein transferase n=1 Tax=Yimella sp. cx-51 TaxID=2770551 RepID=UPI00351C905A
MPSRAPAPVPPSRFDFGFADSDEVDSMSGDLVIAGGDLEPGTLLSAYRHGIFPMGLGDGGAPPLGWWSPQVRGVLLAGDHHVSRSLRRSRAKFEVTVDAAFEQVVSACADPQRDGAWITPQIARAYGRLHELGWAHSVEVWDDEGLAGGLYGLSIAGLFAGESMFHHRTDAGKIALWELVRIVFDDHGHDRIIDVQWNTPHLSTQGVRDLPRRAYRRRLDVALRQSIPAGLR